MNSQHEQANNDPMIFLLQIVYFAGSLTIAGFVFVEYLNILNNFMGENVSVTEYEVVKWSYLLCLLLPSLFAVDGAIKLFKVTGNSK